MALSFEAELGTERAITLARDATFAERVDLLYRTYAARVLALCRRSLGPDWADDACQETILCAARALPSYRGEAPPWRWVRSIALNTCRDFARRRARLGSVELLPEALLDAVSPSPEQVIDHLDAANDLRDGLAAISDRSRRVLWRRAVEGWSYSELGAAERMTPGAARVAYLRARRAVRLRLEGTHLPVLAPVAATRAAWLRLRTWVGVARDRLRRNALVNGRVPSEVPLGLQVVASPVAAQAVAAVMAMAALGMSATTAFAEPRPAASTAPTVGTVHDTLTVEAAFSDAEPPGVTGSAPTAAPNRAVEPSGSGVAPAPAAPEPQVAPAPPPTPTLVELGVSEPGDDPIREQQYDGGTKYYVEYTIGADVGADTGVDLDGDGDSHVGASPYVFVSCGPPETRGPVTTVACPVLKETSE